MEAKLPCTWCGGLYTARGIRLHEMHCVKNPSSPKHKKSTGPSVESLPLEVQSRSVRNLPPEALRSIGELADLHQMSLSECMDEILSRAMETRRGILSQIEDGGVETLYAIQSAVGLWADAGELYEYLMNMTYKEIEAKTDELNEETKTGEEMVESPWENAPAVKTDNIARADSLLKEMEMVRADLKKLKKRVSESKALQERTASENKALQEKVKALEKTLSEKEEETIVLLPSRERKLEEKETVVPLPRELSHYDARDSRPDFACGFDSEMRKTIEELRNSGISMEDEWRS